MCFGVLKTPSWIGEYSRKWISQNHLLPFLRLLSCFLRPPVRHSLCRWRREGHKLHPPGISWHPQNGNICSLLLFLAVQCSAWRHSKLNLWAFAFLRRVKFIIQVKEKEKNVENWNGAKSHSNLSEHTWRGAINLSELGSSAQTFSSFFCVGFH